MAYAVRRLRNCADEPLYEVSFERWDERSRERLLASLDELGTVERPLPDRPLIRMDEPAFVVTGNLDRGRLRLRCKASADVEPPAVRDRLARELARGFESDGRG